MQEFKTVEEWRSAIHAFLTEELGPPLAVIPLEETNETYWAKLTGPGR